MWALTGRMRFRELSRHGFDSSEEAAREMGGGCLVEVLASRSDGSFGPVAVVFEVEKIAPGDRKKWFSVPFVGVEGVSRGVD